MSKLYVFRIMKTGVKSRSFISDPDVALERGKRMAMSNDSPVRIHIAGKKHGVILEPISN